MGLRPFLLGMLLCRRDIPEPLRLRWGRRIGKRIPMQGPRNAEAIQGLDDYEQMVNTFAENAKAYWRLWGPQGEPMIRVVDAWVEQQRAYLQWLRRNYAEGNRP
jgi:hypothetical protein